MILRKFKKKNPAEDIRKNYLRKSQNNKNLYDKTIGVQTWKLEEFAGEGSLNIWK